MKRRRVAIAAGTVALLGITAGVGVARADHSPHASHVLLISVDGMHQSDLDWYVSTHPSSTMAKLVGNGVEFTGAQTTYPSDSFPGMMAQFTGGTPQSVGVLYDDTFNSSVYPAGTTTCTTPVPGGEVAYTEADDINQNSVDAGQGLSPLPASILKLKSNPDQLINPANLPVDPVSCQPIYPHNYIRVNTLFEVAHNAGLLTAWSDKHPAYEMLNGPSGTGVQDFFTPEINSQALPVKTTTTPGYKPGDDWTKDNSATQAYDSFKVEAVLNWIDGHKHDGSGTPGTPAIFGMNFQTVSTAEKLPMSATVLGGPLLPGGYKLVGGQFVPNTLLADAFDYIDAQLTKMETEITKDGLAGNTVIILSAKHGQSPIDLSKLVRIDDGPILNALNVAWHTAHPSAVNPLVAMSTDDDNMLVWLNDRSTTATSFAKDFLSDYSTASSGQVGNNTTSNSISFTNAGLDKIYAGADAAEFLKLQPGDSRAPDILGITKYGVVYTGGKGKIAEHGGDHFDDRHVPLLVSGGPIGFGGTRGDDVTTAQIAPTILELLSLDPHLLQSVQIEHTDALDLP